MSKHDYGLQTPLAGVGLAPAGTATVLAFHDQNTGWIGLGGAGYAVHQTQDGGRTWVPLEQIGRGLSIESIELVTSLEVIVHTRSGSWRTTDGGEQWTLSPSSSGQ
jgi:photosystem II stability/assembly factor-like uncharacterized protein